MNDENDDDEMKKMMKKTLYVFSLLSKNESRLIKSPVCLSVSPPLTTFELLVVIIFTDFLNNIKL
jgi:hypothetical protein